MNFFFLTHSLLRFVVLLLGLAVVVYSLMGLMQKQPFNKLGRVLGTAFAGLLHLQVVVGLAVALTGVWQKKDIGHVVMMVLAAVLAQVMMSLNRRASTPTWARPLIGAGGALVLIIGGIFAIGRLPWAINAF